MKLSLSIALVLLWAATACTPGNSSSAAELPEQRPADFLIRFHESGGPEDPAAEYSIGHLEASYKKIDGIQRQTWAFVVNPAQFDSLYAALRDYHVLDLVSEKEAGKDPDRFGYQLEISYGQTKFSVVDQGENYIQKEADYHRFMDVIADVRAFVGRGIADQMIPVEVELVLDPKSPRPDSLSVDLEQANLIAMNASIEPGDTLWGETKPLRASYNLFATATVAGKPWKWTKVVNLLDWPSHTMLILGADGFKEAH